MYGTNVIFYAVRFEQNCQAQSSDTTDHVVTDANRLQNRNTERKPKNQIGIVLNKFAHGPAPGPAEAKLLSPFDNTVDDTQYKICSNQYQDKQEHPSKVKNYLFHFS